MITVDAPSALCSLEPTILPTISTMGSVISNLFKDDDPSPSFRYTLRPEPSLSNTAQSSDYSSESESGAQYYRSNGMGQSNISFRPSVGMSTMRTNAVPIQSLPTIGTTAVSTRRTYNAMEAQTIAEKAATERAKNAFSQYYRTSFRRPKDPKKLYSVAQEALESYKHEDAIKFAATSFVWIKNSQDSLPVLPKKKNLTMQSFLNESGTWAYYRVISDRGDRYVLVACHVNVHGFHRGDLRFVEVNDRTVVRGSEKHSVVGNLFLGDIVAVTELSNLKKTQISETDGRSIKKINQESECCWAVKTMTLIKRKSSGEVTFAFLENGNAVVKGFEESMTVIPNGTTKREVDKLYIGTAFLPDKVEFAFTVDHEPMYKNPLLAKSSTIPSYPKAFGTIHTFRSSADQTKLFEIGFDAFNHDKKKSLPSSSNADGIVETCALMGYSAANSVFNGRFDCRSFPMKNAQKQGEIVRFSIDNPKDMPTEGRWNCKNRIKFEGDCGGENREITGVIESVTAENGSLQIVARVSRDAPKNIRFENRIHIVQQREPMECTKLRQGFFSKMSPSSNGRHIIEALYGGWEIQSPRGLSVQQFKFDGMNMNQYQCEYVSMILAGTPLVLGSSPFGCGKSMTIVATAHEVFKRDTKIVRSQQLLITQSNYASVNLVDIAKKVQGSDIKFVRFVSEKNWKELPDNCRTSYDFPELMGNVFVKWATGGFEGNDLKRLEQRHKNNMIYFIMDRNLLISLNYFSREARNMFDKMQTMKKPWQGDLLEAFFILHRPDVIMTTADSLQGLLSTKAMKNSVISISTIQIDEASQVPEYTLISLLASFPNATFGLIGDVKQLPPYCEDSLTGKLKDHGVGNTMERAVEQKMFPQAVLRYVYRCHPVTTQLLSDLFYSGQLISGVAEQDRNQFITKRTDFWPNHLFPIIIVDNQEKARRMGTSWSNAAEATLVRQYVNTVSKSFNGYQLKPEQIGVISFYSAQTSVLTEALRGSGVKCGTVDAFQGTEREVVILCCTSERLSDFMQLANRLNVAMSRARQATIVIGNVDGLRKANYWNVIVRKAEDNGCLVNLAQQSGPAGSGVRNHPNGKKSFHQNINKNKKKKNDNDIKKLTEEFNNLKIKK